ncbi:MAG: transcriptional repressor LexA [Deltaproteobacteria bacterium]|nr:transcriptional repressor LexA [Deltaproteobacteria bacterium]
MEELSPRQTQVFNYISSAIEETGVVPSFREIGAALGIKSTNGVSDHIRALIKKGFLERVGDAGKPRSLRLSQRAHEQREDGDTRGIPLLGKVAAGVPLLAEENHRGVLRVDASMLPSGSNLFALEVTGESMIEDGIHDGDYLFIREQPTAHDGEIAVVMVEGEATVKRFFRMGHVIRLQPANSAMKPIFLDSSSGDVKILGVAVGLYRKI